MGLINLILNFAGLLLWLGWRDARVDALVPTSAASLVRTLQRAGPLQAVRWKYGGGLIGLLFFRALLYDWIGPAVDWTPVVQFGPIVIPFRSGFFWQMVLFSFLSFGITLVVFYMALLFLSLINRRMSDGESLQRFVRRHLGRLEHLPAPVKLVLPLLAAVFCWILLGPLLTYLSLVPPAELKMRFWQGGVLGLGLYLLWKYVIAGALLLHFLNSYIYFGNMPVWAFATNTSKNIMLPMRRIWLRSRRVDFAPVVTLVLVLLIAQVVENGIHRGAGSDKVILPGLVDLFRWVS